MQGLAPCTRISHGRPFEFPLFSDEMFWHVTGWKARRLNCMFAILETHALPFGLGFIFGIFVVRWYAWKNN